MKVEILRFKNRASTSLKVKEKEEPLTELANAMENLPDTIQESSSLAAYMELGDIALNRKDGVKAFGYYSKCKNIFGSLEGPELLLMMLDVKIAKAKSKFPGVDTASSLKESISLFKDFNEESKKKYMDVYQVKLWMQAFC